MVKKIRYAMLLLVAVNLAIVAVVFLGGYEPPAPVPLPNPNGYDTLLKAASLLPSKTSPVPVLSADSEVVRLVRLALPQECRVPVEYSKSYISNHSAALQSLNALAHAMEAAGRAAEADQRPADAFRFHLDTVRIGARVGRGGLWRDEMVGLVLEDLGQKGIKRLIPKLTPQECRAAAAELSELNRIREPAQVVWARDSAWGDRVYGRNIREHLIEMIRSRSLDPRAPIRRSMEQGGQSLQRETDLLILDLAARAYEFEKGFAPRSAADLVPAYLKAVPQDPVTGTNLVWRPSAGESLQPRIEHGLNTDELQKARSQNH